MILLYMTLPPDFRSYTTDENNMDLSGLQITVGHRTMFDQIWQMSEQNQILIGHNVRPNKIYCLMKKFCFILLKEKLLFLTKKAFSDFLS